MTQFETPGATTASHRNFDLDQTLGPQSAAADDAAPRIIEVTHGRDLLHVPGLTRWTQIAGLLALRTRYGSMTVLFDDNHGLRIRGSEPGPDAMMQVHDQRVFKRLLTGGNLSFAESYLDGDFDSPDLTKVVIWAMRNEEMDEALLGKPWYRAARRIFHAFRRNSKVGSRRNIAHHYDLGNDFYRLWLDPSMTYSSALFNSQDEALEVAQANKYRRLANQLGLRPEHEVLEIGCGWGGFACLAAAEFGCRVTGITISREQYNYAVERVRKAGLADRVTIELRDYRDLDKQYDRVASIEMFEAVGEQYWPVFFGKLHDSLKPGGIAALQVITIADKYFEAYRGTMDFIQRYIFPGGMLPSPGALHEQTEAAGLRWRDEAAFAPHYARTLETWRHDFRAHWPEIQRQGFDERFRRMWEFYLAYCEGGFSANTIDVLQIALQRP